MSSIVRLSGASIRPEEEAALLGNQLAQLLRDPSQTDRMRELAYYRNSTPALYNLSQALITYSTTRDLTATITPIQATGMGESPQPKTINEIFKNAINPNSHGDLQQTITAIKLRGGKDLDIVPVAEQITSFLPSIARS